MLHHILLQMRLVIKKPTKHFFLPFFSFVESVLGTIEVILSLLEITLSFFCCLKYPGR
jgi:hypothetical protein